MRPLLPLFFILPLAGFAQTADPEVDDLKAQLEALKKQVAAFESKLNAVTQARSSPQPSYAAVPAAKPAAITPPPAIQQAQDPAVLSKAVEDRETVRQRQVSAARPDGAMALYHKGNVLEMGDGKTQVRLGGFVQVDFLHDFRPAGDPYQFVVSSIPVGPQLSTNRSTFSVRPSQMNLDIRSQTRHGQVRMFVEADLFGDNQQYPFVRNLYGQWRGLLGGLTYSTFADPDAWPDTLDFQGPNGGPTNNTTVQARYTHQLGKTQTVAFALEQAAPPPPDFDPRVSLNSVAPNVVFRYRYDSEGGHIQASGVYRLAGGTEDGVLSRNVATYGAQVSAVHFFRGRNNLSTWVAYGTGISEFINDTAGLPLNLGFNNGKLTGIPILGAFASYQHYWKPKLRSTFTYSFANAQNAASNLPGYYHRGQYVQGNLIYQRTRALLFGTEFLYGQTITKGGQMGHSQRMMITMQLSLFQD